MYECVRTSFLQNERCNIEYLGLDNLLLFIINNKNNQ